MVRHLFSFISAILLACALLVCASVVIGQAESGAPLLDGLRLRDCTAPCWIDLTAGESDAQAARDHVGEVFGIALIPMSFPEQPVRFTRETIILPLSGSSAGRSGIPLTLEYGRGVLLNVQMFFDMQHILPLGDILRVYGQPQCVEPQSIIFPGDAWTLYYQQGSTYISVTVLSQGDTALSPRQPVTYITIGTTQGVNMPDTQLCADNITGRYTWRGLAPRWAYHRNR